MPRARIVLLLACTLFVVAAAASAQTATVMQLLQSPRQYVERRVSVSGYYYGNFEGWVLFADREAAKRWDFSRSIWIYSDPPVETEMCRAHIIGVFRWQPGVGYGYLGLGRAAIVNATVHLRPGRKKAPNQAMERTATRRAFTSRVAWMPSPRSTRAPGGRRSSYSR
jgi:hypothetical protein